jgi:nitrogen fixation NifU-like protein
MSNRNENRKDLYAQEEESETPQGPVLYYNEMVMEHFSNPRNIGEMTAAEADGYSLTGDPACGDQLQLWIKVEDGRIGDIRFKCFGCPGAISTSSMMTVLAKGKTIEEAKELTDDDVIDALGGIPERKKHCSLLGVSSLHNAVEDYERKQREEE